MYLQDVVVPLLRATYQNVYLNLIESHVTVRHQIVIVIHERGGAAIERDTHSVFLPTLALLFYISCVCVTCHVRDTHSTEPRAH